MRVVGEWGWRWGIHGCGRSFSVDGKVEGTITIPFPFTIKSSVLYVALGKRKALEKNKEPSSIPKLTE